MRTQHLCVLLAAVLLAIRASLGPASLTAQEKIADPPRPLNAAPAHLRLSVEEAKQRALANNKLLNLAGVNVQSKEYAIRAARADYFPKVVGSVMYYHFNDDLGTVLTAGGRSVTGPRGRTLLTLPTTTINAAVLNQDSSFAYIGALQPITDLLKVRQGVKIAQADQQIAQAQLEQGMRKVASGVEQLYWGLLAARRIRGGAAEGVRGAQMLAQTKTLEARTALVEAKQGLQEVDNQVADLQEQLNGLLDLPLCTSLELVDPPLPVMPYRCADEVIGLALANSPEIREAQHNINKAQAAVAAGKLDYVPSIAVIGGYANQTVASYIQPDIGYLGVVGTYTFIDWGKRRNVIRERKSLITMATLKLQETEDDVRQQTLKAFREVIATRAALKTAEEMVALRTEASKKLATPEAQRNPAPLMAAAKALMLAQVDAVKADLAYRAAYAKLMNLIDRASW